jgi:hypothetical protein
MTAPFVPAIETDQGRLRFFSITEVRLGTAPNGQGRLRSHKRRFALDNDGEVYPATDAEFSAFLSGLIGLREPIRKASDTRTAEENPDHSLRNQQAAPIPRT